MLNAKTTDRQVSAVPGRCDNSVFGADPLA